MKRKLEIAILSLFSSWLVFGFAFVVVQLGLATGDFESWPVEVVRAVSGGVLLFGWLAVVPLAAMRRLWVRLAIGALAAPGAVLCLGSFVEEVPLVLSGRPHSHPVSTTYLASPIAYAFAYYLLAQRKPRIGSAG